MSGTPPVFALHGWALNAAVFESLADRIGSSRLLAIDLPGHGRRREEALGRDSAALVGRLLDAAPPGAVWLGWSLGGMLALAAAAAAPEQVAGLVVVAAGASFVARPGWSAGMDGERLVRMGRQLLEDPARTVDDFLTLQVLSSRGGRHALRALKSALRERGTASPAALADGLALLEGLDLRAAAQRVRPPALIVGGGRDRLVHPAAVMDLAARMPHAELAMIDEAGHAPFLSHGERFAATVKPFLVSVAVTRAGA